MISINSVFHSSSFVNVVKFNKLLFQFLMVFMTVIMLQIIGIESPSDRESLLVFHLYHQFSAVPETRVEVFV